MKCIPVAGPSITQKEIDYVTDAVTNCWYGNANLYHQRFERRAAEYLGVKHAVTLPSCTSAIHLSLLALGVGPGDEVIVPDATWIASAAPISYVGAEPVFADIDEKTWCLSAASLESCISSRTKAVIVVDLYGGMPEMDAIRHVASRHGLAIIEDAAEAFGSQFAGRKAGAFGDTGVFSFHGSKTITTGEGGMLVTDRDDVYHRVLFLRDHGRRPGDTSFFNAEVAYKYKMSSMQAALGLAQVERAEELVQRKRQIFRWYTEQLGGVSEVTLNYEAPGTRNTYWMSTVVVDSGLGIERDRLIEELGRRGIDCRPFFHPLSSIPAYAATAAAASGRERNHVAYRVSPHGMNLPSGMNITAGEVAYVSRALKAALCRSGRSPVRHNAA